MIASSTPTAPKPLPALHNAAQQAGNLRQVLQDDKQRIGCFLGAGCPLGVYDEVGEKSIVETLIKSTLLGAQAL